MNWLKIIPVTTELTDNGYQIVVRGQSYSVRYPESVWSQVPLAMRRLLLDHLALTTSMHLPMVISESRGLRLDTARPLFEPHLFRNFIGDIPSCADVEGRDIDDEIRRFLTTEYEFDTDAIRRPVPWPAPDVAEAGAVIPLTFGKDSLLTFALAEELGLRPRGVFVEEPAFHQELHHKTALADRLDREFGHRLTVFRHETGWLRDARHLGTAPREYGWGLQSTEYAFLLLPLARYWGAEFILFGNEQTAGSDYLSGNGRWMVDPCFDQSHDWTRHIDAMTSLLTAPNPVRVGSLIEPLMDIMVQGILVRRYPRYAALQMSCFADSEGGQESRWCHDCTICAKMYLLCTAFGVHPEVVGFQRSMLTADKRKFYTLLGGDRSPYPYARTDVTRDEQLFAFHSAARFEMDEPLIREFQHTAVAEEARRRELELYDRFTLRHPALTVPRDYQDRLNRILDEEIADFRRRYEAV